MVTQIEVDQELHTLTPSRLTLDWTMKEGRKYKGVRKDGRKEGSARE